MISIERVVELVNGAQRAPEEPHIRGASPEDLHHLEERLARRIPIQLRDWLLICNGAGIGPGGFFGNRADRPSLDLPAVLALYPEWHDQGWLPVAGDGCGNYYVLQPSGQVGFVDTMNDPASIEPPSYPDLFTFAEALLRSDQATSER